MIIIMEPVEERFTDVSEDKIDCITDFSSGCHRLPALTISDTCQLM